MWFAWFCGKGTDTKLIVVHIDSSIEIFYYKQQQILTKKKNPPFYNINYKLNYFLQPIQIAKQPR